MQIGAKQGRERPAAWLGAALLLVALAYVSALSVPFVWDDHELVEENQALDTLGSIPGLFAGHLWSNAESAREGAYYRPLVQASYVVDAALFGRGPAGFHATNVVVHLLVCALVFALALRLGVRPGAAAASALLFGLMPRLSETVTWISGRTDLFATAFALLAVHLFLSAPRGRAARVGAGVALLAGLLCKEVALAALPAILVFTWRRPADQRRLGDLVPIGAAVVVYAALRSTADVGLHPGLALAPLERLGFALDAVGQYAWMLADPFSPLLLPRALGVSNPGMTVLGGGVLVLLGGGLWVAARRGAPPLVWALVALGLAAIAPVLHLVPIPQPALAADRFLYLPLAALSALGALAVERVARFRPAVAWAVVGALALPLALSLDQRNRVWQDEVALFQHGVAESDGALGYAEIGLGAALAREGRLDEAILAYASAIEQQQSFAAARPGFSVERQPRADLALLLSELGRFDEAMPLLEGVLAERDDDARLQLFHGIALARQLEFARADRAFERAQALHPDYAMARTIQRQTRMAAAILSRLPAHDPNAGAPEPIEAQADRAQAFHLLGRVDDANALFAAVVAAPDATPDMITRARTALAQQRSVLGDTPATRHLAAALEQSGTAIAARPAPRSAR